MCLLYSIIKYIVSSEVKLVREANCEKAVRVNNIVTRL